MLYTKFKGHGLAGFREEDFEGISYVVMAAILVTWAGMFEQTFILTTHKRSTYNFVSMGIVPLQQKTFDSINMRDLWLIFIQVLT